jgi:signal transduction histidine kinase
MRERLAEELSFHEKMTGILSHDLRNPLTAITMAADRLSQSPEPSPTARDQAQRIRRSAGRMKEMIDTLLDFTSLRFLGRFSVSRVPADLGEITRAAVDELRVIWPEQPLELELRGDTRADCDPGRMSQAVSNLVANAVTHGERGTPVHICVLGAERQVELKVRNWGAPIPSDLMPVLFQPFRRRSRAARPRAGPPHRRADRDRTRRHGPSPVDRAGRHHLHDPLAARRSSLTRQRRAVQRASRSTSTRRNPVG